MVGNDNVCMGKIGDSNGTGVDGVDGYEGDGHNSHDDGRGDDCD